MRSFNHRRSTSIVFDDRILLRQRSGIAIYTSALLAHLGPLLRYGELALLSENIYSAPFRLLSKRAGSISPKQSSGTKSWLAYAQRLVAAYEKVAKPLIRGKVFHAPDLFPIPNRAERTLVTVHDLSVIRYPHWHPEHRVAKYERQLSKLDPDWEYIAVSQSTKNDLSSLMNIDADRIHVVLEAPRPEVHRPPPFQVDATLAKFRIHTPYFLYLGTIEPRKNVESLLHAYAGLPHELRARLPLVLAGGWGWKSDGVRALLECSPWKEEVRYLGYVSDEDAASLVTGARALCYPSYFEGFGLPPLEAMVCGTAVLSSSEGGLAESVGDAACLIDPNDVGAIRLGLQRIGEDDAYVEHLRLAGQKQVAKFSWRTAAEQTLAIYRKLGAS